MKPRKSWFQLKKGFLNLTISLYAVIIVIERRIERCAMNSVSITFYIPKKVFKNP